jgi:ATP-binding cassette, subfamily C (CFTR/MRP), member 1
VAATVHYLEHARSRVARGCLLFYWLLFTIFNGVKVRSLYVRHEYKEHQTSVIVLTIIEAMAIIIFGLELIPKMNSEYSLAGEDPDKRCPMEDANIFSILTFGWMTGTMKAGYEKFLTEDDLWDLRHKDTAAGAREKFASKWDQEAKRERPRLWFALFKAFGGPFFEGTIYKVIQDVLNYAQPQLLRFLIAFIASYKTPNPQPAIRGFSIAILMFVLSVIQTITLHRYFQHAFETGMRFKTALTTTIYRKAMVLSNEGRAAKSTGDSKFICAWI